MERLNRRGVFESKRLVVFQDLTPMFQASPDLRLGSITERENNMGNTLRKSIAVALASMALGAGSAQAGVVAVNDWTLDLSAFGPAPGLGQVTKLNEMTFTGLFNTTVTSPSGTLAPNDTGGVNGLITITAFNTSKVPSVRTFTDSGKVLGLDFELTASFSVPIDIGAVASDGVLPTPGVTANFSHPLGGNYGYDGVLDIWVDISPDADTSSPGGGSGFEGGPGTTLLATFGLVPGGGGTFNTRTLDGSDDATFSLISALPGVFLDSNGVDLATGTLLGLTNSNTDADSDNNGIADTLFTNAPPSFGTCRNINPSNCGREDGSFTIAGSVPEPGSMALIGLGLLGLASQRRQKAA